RLLELSVSDPGCGADSCARWIDWAVRCRRSASRACTSGRASLLTCAFRSMEGRLASASRATSSDVKVPYVPVDLFLALLSSDVAEDEHRLIHFPCPFS